MTSEQISVPDPEANKWIPWPDLALRTLITFLSVPVSHNCPLHAGLTWLSPLFHRSVLLRSYPVTSVLRECDSNIALINIQQGLPSIYINTHTTTVMHALELLIVKNENKASIEKRTLRKGDLSICNCWLLVAFLLHPALVCCRGVKWWEE